MLFAPEFTCAPSSILFKLSPYSVMLGGGKPGGRRPGISGSLQGMSGGVGSQRAKVNPKMEDIESKAITGRMFVLLKEGAIEMGVYKFGINRLRRKGIIRRT